MLGLGNSLQRSAFMGNDIPNSYSGGFDGTDDYVSVASASEYAFGTGDFTFSAWIYPTNISDGYDMILTFGNPAGESTPYFTIKDSKLEFYLSGVYTSDVGYITINQWQHTAVTRTSGTVQLYLDGVALGSTSSQTTSVPQALATIGAYVPSGSGHYFNGNIDEVGIWDSALTASEMLTLYNNGKPIDLSMNVGNYTSSSDLISWWRFEEGTGTTVADSSTNSNTGTLENSVAWDTATP